MIPPVATSTLPSSSAQVFAVVWPSLLPLIISAIGSVLTKEKDFMDQVDNLLKKVLEKRVVSLKVLIEESITYTPTTLSEEHDLKGKRFFSEMDKYASMKIKATLYRKIYRGILSFLHYGVVVSLLLAVALFANYLIAPITIASWIFFAAFLIAFILARVLQSQISKMCESEDLTHFE